MKSKETPTRIFGQCSITSSFLSRSSNSSKGLNGDLNNKDSKKLTSLSDFLNRKLPSSSGISKTIQEKTRPFSSLLGPKEGEFIDKQKESKNEGVETEKNDVIDKVIFEQFKQDNTEKAYFIASPNGFGDEEEGAGTSDVNEGRNSRKRQNPFQVVDEERRTRKPFIVLGDEPQKPKKRRRKESSINNNKKPEPHYNHYANGSGWWDCDMEGVDNEEVGFAEVWEGVGSTTLGGIVDWH